MPKPKPSPSRLAAQYQSYPTADAAAVAALRGITNKKNETGGGILYNKEQNVYAATEPVGQNDDAHFSASVGVPKGWQLHSTYHTHPSGSRSTLFSGDDISMAQQLKAPSYVLALDDNKVRMFDPASSKVSKNQSVGRDANDGTFAYGSQVDESKLPQALADVPPAPLPPSAPVPPAPVPPAAPPSPVASAPASAAAIPVTGSRVTMKDFASQHRAATTKYRHKIIDIKKGAPKRP